MMKDRKPAKVLLTLRLPRELMRLATARAKRKGYESRSQYVRYLIERDLKKRAV